MNEYGPVAPYRTFDELERCRATFGEVPRKEGRVELIVLRTSTNERARPLLGELHPERGLVGDRWEGSGRTPLAQITLMDVRAAGALGEREYWHLFGDNLLVDLSLDFAALKPCAQLSIGTALLEITEEPHLGCKKFSARFGPDALRWVNYKPLRELRLRGVHAQVVKHGQLQLGDVARVLE